MPSIEMYTSVGDLEQDLAAERGRISADVRTERWKQ